MAQPTELEPPKVRLSTALIAGGVTFVAGAVATYSTYGRLVRYTRDLNIERWGAVSEIATDAMEFLEEKKLLEEFINKTGHLRLIGD